MRFTNSVPIRRDPSEVFDFLANPENLTRWNPAIASVEPLTAGPIGEGSRWRQIRTSPGPVSEEIEIRVFRPGQRLVFVGDLGPFTGTMAYEFRGVPGGTELLNEADLRARGPVGLLSGVAAPLVRRAVAENLDRLRSILEAEHTG